VRDSRGREAHHWALFGDRFRDQRGTTAPRRVLARAMGEGLSAKVMWGGGWACRLAPVLRALSGEGQEGTMS
jgi:hypothetical protein